MQFQFKIQNYQTKAVEAVVDCFKGQPKRMFTDYQVDSGSGRANNLFWVGYKNADLITDLDLLGNIQAIQRKNGIPISERLAHPKISNINLDIEMETGTGKTYCYIKTIFELNKQYGWTKFIIVVPSIAIREGVAKSFEVTAKHFYEIYSKKIRYFIYQSNRLNALNGFSSDANIHAMIINIQAFNAQKDARRINEACDDFQSRRPIDVISANRPILILDEPQKMGGEKTLEGLKKFNALMALYYSATHKIEHNKIYRLDTLDAVKQKLIKKIRVCGVTRKHLTGTDGYLYLKGIDKSKKHTPIAHLEFDQRLKNGEIKRISRKVEQGDNLFALSNELSVYREGYTVSNIDAYDHHVSFINGLTIEKNDIFGNIDDLMLRRIQIREAIKAHFKHEQSVFDRDIKVLSLFFIDEVSKYRNYEVSDGKGEYAKIFEEEYCSYLNELLPKSPVSYGRYIKNIGVSETHAGYFSIDKKTKHLIDPQRNQRGEQADDINAYDLILKDKERLLSFENPVRFIFSHSALREGWDNPNVFVIGMLKNSDNTVSRRQEVGRGLRLCVNRFGERIDDSCENYPINILTVVASESYIEFAERLQNEILIDLTSGRLKFASIEHFMEKSFNTLNGPVEVTEEMAHALHGYLIENNYIDKKGVLLSTYIEAFGNQTLVELPKILKPYEDAVRALINDLDINNQIGVSNLQTLKENHLNDNFYKKEFQALWNHINYKAIYHVQFDSNDLIKRSVDILNKELNIFPRQYIIERGEQKPEAMTRENLYNKEVFGLAQKSTETDKSFHKMHVIYNPINELVKATGLKRNTICEILSKLDSKKFEQFQVNPEIFISKSSMLINDEKSSMMINGLIYHLIDEKFSDDVFSADQVPENGRRILKGLKKHIYDNLVTVDSVIEESFAQNLEISTEVVVYAKLPRKFYISTPIGKYNPDWAISFEKEKVRYIYFVVETKGSVLSSHDRGFERNKINCAEKFFKVLNEKLYSKSEIKFCRVKNFDELMSLNG